MTSAPVTSLDSLAQALKAAGSSANHLSLLLESVASDVESGVRDDAAKTRMLRRLREMYELGERIIQETETEDQRELRPLLARESQAIEFKETMRWDVRERRVNPDLSKLVAKTVAGFLNSRKGGHLLIGVDDRGQPRGLDPDLATFKSSPSKSSPDDAFQRTFDQLLANYLGGWEVVSCIERRFRTIDGKLIFHVSVPERARDELVFFVDAEKVELYVRIGPATRPLNVREAIDYALSYYQARTRR